MKNINKITVSMIALSIIAFSISSMAGTGHELTLDAIKDHPAAKGTALIKDNYVSIQARGLKSNSVYTVWFVNMKPKKHETGAGSAPYMFKTDANGFGQYSALLSESPFGKWQMIMIVLHPNGDPTDMKSMVGALKAKLA
jgi:hypothetical protein